jgi:tetratricopeptide (TPR) repeat protein
MQDAEFYYRRGLEKNLQDNAEAIDDYTRAIDLNPSYLDAYLRRGTFAYRVLKRYEASLADFDRAIELKPDCAYAYLHRGIVKCHLLRFEAAIPDFDRAIELDPNDERAYLNRGKNRHMLGYSQEDVCTDLGKAILLGSPQAADMIELFYGKDRDAVKEAVINHVREKSRQMQKRYMNIGLK